LFEIKHKNFNEQFTHFSKEVENKRTFFFLVYGGKFSEGVDFMDDLARMIIILGIPFADL